MPRELVPLLFLFAIGLFTAAASMMHLLHPGTRRIPFRKCIGIAVACVAIMMVLAPGLFRIAEAIVG